MAVEWHVCTMAFLHWLQDGMFVLWPYDSTFRNTSSYIGRRLACLTIAYLCTGLEGGMFVH